MPDPYIPDVSLPRAVLVDVDGTIALREGRGPYDFDRCGEDAPNKPVITVVRAMEAAGHRVVFCSGRPDVFRRVTAWWIAEHTGVHPEHLYMRPSRDERPDEVVKLELFDKHIRHRFNVVCVFDDRARVVAAWRSVGLVVLQCAEGDF